MDENRKFGIVGGLGLLFAFSFLLVVTYHPLLFYWGLPLGFILGIVTCIYLSEAWDPYLLEPRNPKTKKASWNLLWVVPLGVLVANITSKFLGEDVRQLLLGCAFGWIFVTFGYFIIQAWRYR